MIHINRYHDISCGHRVVGHEGQCANLHGHNYRIHLTCSPEMSESKDPKDIGLDDVGRVLDFSEVKKRICTWLDEVWDHKFLVWDEDPWRDAITKIDPKTVWVSFNPTAENIAIYLVDVIGPQQLKGTGVVLTSCTVDETRKCSATAELGIYH